MNVQDLQLTDLLECHPDEGVIRLHEQRVVILSASALGVLRKELIENLGVDLARRLLTRFGYTDGYQDAVSLRDRYASRDPLEHLKAGPPLHTVEGIVRAQLTNLSYDPAHQRFDAEVEWRNSYEGDQHLHHHGRSAAPVCWSLVGYASGYATACLGHEVFFREVQCVGQGAEHCIIEGKDVESWGDLAQRLRDDFAGANLKHEVERLRESARARQQEVARRERRVAQRERELDRIRERVAKHTASKRFIVRSRAMQEVLEQAARVAPLDVTVLIGGESGTGKEFLVRMIHDQSARGDGPLVSVNCAALTETLLESELFGHVRGAFTGAVRDKPGLFETASNGTLFLDEVGEMSPGLQAKLLRALQEGEIRRVGGDRAIRVSPRVVAASNRDLRAAVTAGTFREDLYFRLGAFVISSPPLRERREAIPALCVEFVRRASARFKKEVHSIAPEAMVALTGYRWPGNVRELEHAIERAVILAEDCVITTRELPPEVHRFAEAAPAAPGSLSVREHEKVLIQQALAKHPGSRQNAASELGISTVTLWRRMKEYGLTS